MAARVKAILKRTRPMPLMQATTRAAITEFTLDNERKAIYFREQLLGLTRLEFCLLQALVEQPGRVFSREQLLDALGISADAGYDRSIDGHIKTLRAKLRAVAPDAEPIKTLRGFGYAYQPGI
jgi:two-component system catabolic regulation response regulator CreB